MRKVKVLHIITRLITGGAPENTLLTVEGLDKGRYEVVLAVGAQSELDDGLIKEFKDKNINLVIFPHLLRQVSPLNDLLFLVKLCSFLKKSRFDIVHTHTSKAGILGRWAAKLAGVPVIIHSTHGQYFYGYFNFFLTRLFIALERLTAFISDKIITLTNIEIEQHLKYQIGKISKFVAIISGIKLEKFRSLNIDFENKRKELGLTLQTPVVGVIGALVPIKGHHYLIKAAYEVRKTIPDVKFVIVGEGFLSEKLKKQVQNLKLEDKVIFLGRRDDVSEILSVLDLYVQPSLNEGMGRIIVAAMGMGLPVVATRVGGVPEIVADGETGILVPSKDSLSLAEAIIYLLTNKEKAKKMAKAGGERIGFEFSAEFMVKRISKVYQESLARKKG